MPPKGELAGTCMAPVPGHSSLRQLQEKLPNIKWDPSLGGGAHLRVPPIKEGRYLKARKYRPEGIKVLEGTCEYYIRQLFSYFSCLWYGNTWQVSGPLNLMPLILS